MQTSDTRALPLLCARSVYKQYSGVNVLKGSPGTAAFSKPVDKRKHPVWSGKKTTLHTENE